MQAEWTTPSLSATTHFWPLAQTCSNTVATTPPRPLHSLVESGVPTAVSGGPTTVVLPLRIKVCEVVTGPACTGRCGEPLASASCAPPISTATPTAAVRNRCFWVMATSPSKSRGRRLLFLGQADCVDLAVIVLADAELAAGANARVARRHAAAQLRALVRGQRLDAGERPRRSRAAVDAWPKLLRGHGGRRGGRGPVLCGRRRP